MESIKGKPAALIVGVLLLFGIMGGVLIRSFNNKENDEAEIKYYTFAEVEKPVSYLASDDDTLYKLSRLIDPLYKSDYIDIIYVRQMTDALGLPDSIYKDLLAGFEDTDFVPAETFDTIYERIIDSGEIEGIEKIDIFLYEVTYYDETEELSVVNDADDENITSEDATSGNATVTDATPGDSDLQVQGENTAIGVFDGYTYYDIDMVEISPDLINKIVTVYIKNGSIFRIAGESSAEKSFTNVWIIGKEDDRLKFILNEKTESFKVLDTVEVEASCVADISFTNEGITNISYKKEEIRGRVTQVTDEGLRVEEYGGIPLSDNFKIYNISEGEPYCEYASGILTGYRDVRLVMENGIVEAAIIDGEIAAEEIRVILSDSTYSSYRHIAATVTSDEPFKLIFDEDTEEIYEAGAEIKILPKDYNVKDVIRVETVSGTGKLSLVSVTRSGGIPEYRGALEITVRDGYLYVVNELPLEEYLYSVVSSEVPSSYSTEALKAMAICARGYAYSKISDGSYASYGAHLDDSTMCQVYNNVPETEESIFAVKDTYGIVPVYEDDVIVPFYFSTSAGVTCSNDDIWGGRAYEYLKSNVENIAKTEINLSEESDFIAFINDSSSYNTIEASLPFYRWRISYTNEEISNAINSTLEDRMEMSDGGIKVQNSQGRFVNKSIETIGEVESIEITERSESGVVMEMIIYGTENVIQVSGQTNIRNLITPKDVVINRNDGSQLKGWTSIPSPFYYIEQVQGGFTIVGGGFGHGVGMSQNGAQLLAESGYDYKYILTHYFTDIEFENIYEDSINESEDE